MANIWKPGVYPGSRRKKDYFEGWYFKSVSADEKTAYAIAPECRITRDPETSHAFIMIMDARDQKLFHFKYPLLNSGPIKINSK